MFRIALYSPRIPPNTGAAARLCAATGAQLHLIRPLGFRVDNAAMKRAGLDYWRHVDVRIHEGLTEFLTTVGGAPLHILTKSGQTLYTEAIFSKGDWLLFGSETDGLPEDLLKERRNRTLFIPQIQDQVRSLNLASSVSIVLYEALRQNNFNMIAKPSD